MEWIIYKHTNKINGKCYIGQTKQIPTIRWANGLGYNPYKNPKTCIFWNALTKYGWDNFSHEILEKDIKSQTLANEREIYWIKKYNSYVGFPNSNGYNMTLGGNNSEHLGYPVYQISKHDLSIINEFKSTAEAAREFGKDIAAQIRRCCEGIKVSCKGYYWCYVNKYKANWTPKENEQLSPILQIDEDLEVVRKYDSISECVKLTGFSLGSIISCCKRKQRKANNFYWCYLNDYSESWEPPITSFKRNEKIFCFETNMIYNSAKEASLKTGANKSHIHRCCKKLENGSNGLHFCYLQDKDNFVLNPTMKRADNFTNQENLLLKQKYPFMGISNKLLELFPNKTLGSLRQQAHRLNLKYIGENKGNKKVLCVELNKKFNSIEDAYRYVNLKDGSSISRCCQGKRNTAAGYHWEYIENIKKD